MHIMIAMACYGDVRPITHRSLMALQHQLLAEGHEVCEFNPLGDPILYRARQACLVAAAEATDVSHILWVDADVGFCPETAMSLLTSPHQIAAAVQPLKQSDKLRFPVQMRTEQIVMDSDGFVEVERIPLACCVMRREVIERMRSEFEDRCFCPAETEPDYSFCDRWRSIGGTIHVLASAVMSHATIQQQVGSLASLFQKRPADGAKAAITHATSGVRSKPGIDSV